MAIFFTSDLHFSHDRGFLYEPRGFNSIEEMNETVINNWNSVVSNEDTVYILGDLILNDNEKGIECLNRLNGIKKFVIGNHDTDTRVQLYQDNGLECLGYATVIKYEKYHFYLSHYPTYSSNLEKDDRLTQHMINLYGHTHQKTNFYQDIPFMYHCGLDSHNNYPVSIDQIIEDIKNKINECKEML